MYHATTASEPYVFKPFPLHKRQAGLLKKWNILNMAASDEAMESEISAMKAKDIRQELESYGIPTKSFFEKSELVDALIQARKEGKTLIETNDTATVNGAEEASATSAASGSTTSGSSRQDRMKEEMAKCKSTKVSELKK
jgi:predicted transcriptional regulator